MGLFMPTRLIDLSFTARSNLACSAGASSIQEQRSSIGFF
jgi:hypothetical protein